MLLGRHGIKPGWNGPLIMLPEPQTDTTWTKAVAIWAAVFFVLFVLPGCGSKMTRTYPNGVVDQWKIGAGNRFSFPPDPNKPVEVRPDKNVVDAVKESAQAGGNLVIEKTFELLNKQATEQQ